ncbi:MAG: hypothetical protein WBY88_03140, partial [Desulfosarcina sp.]
MKINGSDLPSKLTVYRTAQVQEKNPESARSDHHGSLASQQDRVALSGRGQLIADAQRAMASI